MLLSIKPCPHRGADHVHTRWAVASSSVIRPLRFTQCGEAFYQKGLSAWFWSYLLVPTGLLSTVHWSIGLVGVFVICVLILLYVNRRYSLVKGHTLVDCPRLVGA